MKSASSPNSLGSVLSDKVQLNLTDPPCSSRREEDAKKTVENKLSVTNMRVLGLLIANLVRSDVHETLFCI